jgi:hypothetical protein
MSKMTERNYQSLLRIRLDISCTIFKRSRDSVIGIATGYGGWVTEGSEFESR